MNYLQPWKLGTLAIGMVFLLWGALTHYADDWTITNSIVMGFATYLAAPWSYWLWKRGDVPGIVASIAIGWAVIDPLYLLVNTLTGDPIYREVNLLVSPFLYGPCAIVWGRNESLAEMVRGVRA